MKNIATYIKSYFESCKNKQTFQMGRKKKDEEGEDEHLVVLNGTFLPPPPSYWEI